VVRSPAEPDPVLSLAWLDRNKSGSGHSVWAAGLDPAQRVVRSLAEPDPVLVS
jgi:hypothetical protein